MIACSGTPFVHDIRSTLLVIAGMIDVAPGKFRAKIRALLEIRLNAVLSNDSFVYMLVLLGTCDIIA